MSFNFQPAADSSDEETGIDLSAWKAGAVAKQAHAPVAPMGVAGHDDYVQAGSVIEDEEVLAFTAPVQRQGSLKRRWVPPEPVKSVSRVSDVRSRHSSSRTRSTEPEVEVRVVLPFRVNDGSSGEEDVEDFTAGGDVVRRILREVKSKGGRGRVVYRVEMDDWSLEEIPFDKLLSLENGPEALEDFTNNPPSEAEDSEITPAPQKRRAGPTSRKHTGSGSKMTSTRLPRNTQRRNDGMVSTIDNVEVSEDDDAGSNDDDDVIAVATHRTSKRNRPQEQYVDQVEQDDEDEDPLDIGDDSEAEDGRRTRRTRTRINTVGAGCSLRNRKRGSEDAEDGASQSDSDEFAYVQSDLPGAKKRRPRRSLREKRAEPDSEEGDIGFEPNKRQRTGERQSGRATRHQGGMQERDINDVYRSDSDGGARAPIKPKVSGAREAFITLPRNDEFRMRHNQTCEVCNQGPNFAALIYCQGCTLAYHKQCLGHRTNREHLATKVGEGNFVLQCRRCVAHRRKAEPTAPHHGKCAECHAHGTACQPFRPRKTPAQEQKERDENDGEDPIHEIHESRLNHAENVLFRCVNCWRAFHFDHLPSRSDMMDLDSEVDAEQRFREYSRDWKCKECLMHTTKASGLVAWKPMDEDTYDPALSLEEINEDDKVYLVRWEGMSYFRASWMPGAWVWGTTTHMMRKAFAKREDNQHPKMRTEDAIPEDFLRTDIVLDIRFTSIVDIHTEEIDKARIREISKALIKYKGLGYEDAVWEAPPSPDDGERWSDFVISYNDWVAGRYVKQPRGKGFMSKLDKARTQDFSKLEKKVQPDNLQGGTLMQYQIEGLNWLYYKWFTQKNAILADEMGLGKTIQIIGFLATMVQDWNCFPFLVVVPNSTCPNWRREIKRWAPGLRVVAYYGSRESRDLAYRYELFPEGSKDLRCHVVVTSYDAAADENCRKFFRGVPWQGLIVDEGQRLKNDKNLLYSALAALKAPFRILLTGTPLQNNKRELFNLLHFLDETYDAATLDERYQDLDAEKITELHDLIRPFFLRRTKAQVLDFLPPMAQIIVPVSMTLVQKKLYRTILAKNQELMKAIFNPNGSLAKAERASLSNILMQLRKCLCHPFVYSQGIEERDVGVAASHRNLVDASGKLKLLELLLPKLRERGHRVLIFSQFLNQLNIVEDFMDGLAMPYQRLDGQISALQKQKRIDEFNAPDSPLFAFLLSTRAGGVGINLATADTVIILDPDFNPHQDIQALSRAHRIGQTKKVLCFQLVTRASAEERIMQMGRRKLALDHVLIQEMDADDAEQTDLVSVLKHGANEIFEDSGESDVVYDANAVERLLDRSGMEAPKPTADKSAEVQFSVARVWANNGLVDAETGFDTDYGAPGMTRETQAPMADANVWAKILQERERLAVEDAAAKAADFGRGRRARGQVDYKGEVVDGAEVVEGGQLGFVGQGRRKKKRGENDESDTDFQAEESGGDDEYGSAGEEGELVPDERKLLEQRPPPATNDRDTGRKKHGKQLPTPTQTPDKKKAKSPVTAKASPKTKNTRATWPTVTPKAPAPAGVKKPRKSTAARKPKGQALSVIVISDSEAETTSKASPTSVKKTASLSAPAEEPEQQSSNNSVAEDSDSIIVSSVRPITGDIKHAVPTTPPQKPSSPVRAPTQD